MKIERTAIKPWIRRKDYKRLLVVVPSMRIGGAERLTLDLLQKLDRSRYKVGLCLFEAIGDLLRQLPKDLKLYCFEKRSKWSFLKLVTRLRKTIRDYNPDVIYTRMWYATFVAVVARKLFNSRIAHIATQEHNSIRDIENKGLLGIAKKLAVKWSYRNVNLVVVMSEGVKREIAENYRMRQNKIEAVYGAVDIESVSSSIKEECISFTSFFANAAPVVITLGRLIARKGFSDLIRAFALVRSKCQSNLIIIGEGEERGNLENLVLQLGLSDHIRLIGYQDNPYKYISRSDVFVLSSHWEGFANVIIEAMACGVPVISTSCPHGPQEIITHGVDGLLVPVGNIDALANSIRELLEHPKRKKSLGQAGRERAAHFSVEKMVEQYQRLFDAVDAD